MFKKFAAVSLSLVLTAGIAAGCGTKTENNSATPAPSDKKQEASAPKGYQPKELKVQFVPSQSAETLEAKAKPLEKLLGDKLGIPVKVSVSTNYNTVIEAMASKQVDIGFLPPNAYVLAHDEKKAADLLLQAQRYGVDEKTGADTKDLVDFYKAMIIVKADSPIKELKDLKGKKIAWQGVTSSAGFVWPANEMKKAGVDPEKDVTGIEVKGHDKGILAVMNGQVDAAAVFQDARNTVKKDIPDIFEKTKVVAFTAPIPNDTITVRNDMDQTWRDKIAQAFIDIGKDPEGGKIIFDVYSHRGYMKSDDKKFDVVREYSKGIGQK
ncbi:phosphate/phosphite/phosphonate ABC transporter substrate-binding protein [Paenibacillus elgii]|uniref:phosphate/phosphite/phosphonate ABC transporter substrate-binding protein n=1 Tax=Paenibacillus elgii TaxID=189691 RepID=UPI00203DB9DC|nr:phosphate/phosphite/phosphonate ABC transporter substrate-binding protein [Paenibacillus elgii]MCM3268145.1 phosphate/phosphite/phosphonate ABC transporter substrate-binding protein [Paenibacillus elgii]GMX63113.1 phosphate/phosphite/phosphonate ABC transporter substrate-binding protein [Paenibacillus elgii]